MAYAIGFDLGATTLQTVLLGEDGYSYVEMTERVYGRPLVAIQRSVWEILWHHYAGEIVAVGVTGSGARLLQAVCGGVSVQDELPLLRDYCARHLPEVTSIVQMGYEETAFLQLDAPNKRKGRINECVRGLGSFWQNQLVRMGLTPGEWDWFAAKAEGQAVHISAKCPAMMVKDMLQKEQFGYDREMLTQGANEAIIRCYLQNTAKDAQFDGDILFIGQLANSLSLANTLAAETGQSVHTDKAHEYLHARAIAKYAWENQSVGWRGEAILHDQYGHQFSQCDGCENHCELTQLTVNGVIKAAWGGRCDRWDHAYDEISQGS